MKPERVLITGANGFIGSHLVKRYLSEGVQVMIVVRDSSNMQRLSGFESQISILRSSMNNIATQQEKILEFAPQVVFHLAWSGGNSSTFVNDPNQYYKNISGSLELIRLAYLSGTQRFIGFGSVVEYGVPEVPCSERQIPKPLNLYGKAKLALWDMTRELCAANGMSLAWVRPFWLFGEADDPLRLIPLVTRQFLNRESPKLTAGEQLWDYLYIKDALEALMRLGQNYGAIGVFNLGSGKAYPLSEIVTFIRDQINPQLSTGLGEIPYASNQIMHLQADISRLTQAVGWTPHHSIWDGLRLTIDSSRAI